jgi:hypothetical protein
MIGRSSHHRSFPRGSQIPPMLRSSLLGLPTRSRAPRSPVITAPTGNRAMEMPALWKPQNGFHSALEISPRTRDSHIPTADHFLVSQEDDEEEDLHASRTTARQTATG